MNTKENQRYKIEYAYILEHYTIDALQVFIVNNLIAKLKGHCAHQEIIQKQALLEMAHLWFYNFKFRIFTAQSLEVAICSFFAANGNRSTMKI